jgi:transcriptional regulator with XRE-family HTH domain
MKGTVVPREVDAVDDYIERLSEDDPDSAVFIAAYESNEELVQALIDAREAAGVSQRQLAKTMGTSPSVVGRMEAGHADPRQSTVARYAAALRKVVRWELVDYTATQSAASRPAGVPLRHYVSGDPGAITTWEYFPIGWAQLATEELQPSAASITGVNLGSDPARSSLSSSRLAA